jgi:hypothetical protein
LSLVEKEKTRHHPAQFSSRAAPAWRRMPDDDVLTFSTT